MLRNLLLIIVFSISLLSQAQIYDPVSWKTSIEKKDHETYLLSITATLEPEWKIYGLQVPKGGPLATEIQFELPNGITLEGNTTQPEIDSHWDPIFQMNITSFKNKVSFSQIIRTSLSSFDIPATISFMVCNDQNCLPPTQENLHFSFPNNLKNSNTSKTFTISSSNDETKNVTNTSIPKKDRGVWSLFFISFLSGFAALLTPCVFPMIPLTVSFFTKQSKTKAKGIQNAVAYGVSIILLYVLLGTIVTSIFGADALNALSTNVWFNLIFFSILILFAISFLGAFEIRLPQRWSNAADRQSQKKGIIGILGMALALAIVSFSCTGPIVGTLLVEAASKGGTAPIIGMLGFSLAIALPFSLFAIFPGWLQSLPKSGGWMQSVKITLGFLELALALKFLSNADMVLQLHLLERELFLALWIGIFLALTLYLFGILKFSNEAPSLGIGTGRALLATLVLSFTMYLIPGLWGLPSN